MDFEVKGIQKSTVKIGDSVYPIELPSALMMASYHDKIKGLGEDNLAILKCTIGFLTKIGMPQERCEKLTIQQLQSLMEFVGGVEKNS